MPPVRALLGMMAVLLAVLLVALPVRAGQSLTGPAVPAAPAALAAPGAPDIVLTATGCERGDYTIPSTHPSDLLVLNLADTAMVFTVPDLRSAVTVMPQGWATMSLPPVPATVGFLCIEEREHAALMAVSFPASLDNMFVCSLGDWALAPRALSGGTLQINRP